MFSRLIVKGLPCSCTEAKLRSLFGPYGTITDCNLKYTKDGKFRGFAYIGFSDESAAQKALTRLHNSYFGSSIIKVEECKPFGDLTKPRAWSKYSKGSSAYKRIHLDEGVSGLIDTIPDKPVLAKVPRLDGDKKFRNFLNLHGENTVEQRVSTDEIAEGNTELQDFLRENETSLSALLYNLPPSVKQKNLKEWLNPIRIKSLKIFRNEEGATAVVKLQKQGDLKRILARSGGFLGGFKVTIKDAPKTQCFSGGFQKGEETLRKRREAEAEICRDTILETGRLFVRNLPYTCVEDDLVYLFKKYGEVAEVQLLVNKKTNQCKGFAIVTYVFPENAVAAYAALDGSVFKGRMLHILPGAEKKEKTANDNGCGESLDNKSTFKKEKMKNLKVNAGKAHSWNTLFLGANAVAETLAERLKVEKSDLLSNEGETSAGVRLALGETRLVRETRDFLTEHNVCLDSFSRPSAKRSETVIIVKNLPANVSVDELERMFGRFGTSNKVLLPPGGITAIVEMSNIADARNAFNTLAYSRFRAQPLYLEWAPIDVFNKKDVKVCGNDEQKGVNGLEIHPMSGGMQERSKELTSEDKKVLRRSKKRKMKSTEDEVTIEAEDGTTGNTKTVPYFEVKGKEEDIDASEPEEFESDEIAAGPGTSVFVKNLDFSTTEESLRKKFASKYRVRNAVISKKLDIKDPSQTLSMGFGFVQFYRASDAHDAIKHMQGTLLDGHALELKLSNRVDFTKPVRSRKEVSGLDQGNRTKIHVKNIPFQARRKEVQQLFSTFGDLRAFRIPRRAGAPPDSHRGFGFVDYLTVADARRAFNELSHSTHLYGKRLVLEWAKSDEDIEYLREKAWSNVSANSKEVASRRKKLKEIERDLAIIDDD